MCVRRWRSMGDFTDRKKAPLLIARAVGDHSFLGDKHACYWIEWLLTSVVSAGVGAGALL